MLSFPCHSALGEHAAQQAASTHGRENRYMATVEPDLFIQPPPEAIQLGGLQRRYPRKQGVPVTLWLLAGGVVFLICGGILAYTYFYVPVKNGPREPLAWISAGAFVLGAVQLIAAHFCRQKTSSAVAEGDGFLLCRDGLVWQQGEDRQALRWDEVAQLMHPQSFGDDYKLVADDGRQMPIRRYIHGYLELLGTVITRVNQVLLPRAVAALEEGDAVSFGPFAVSRDALAYKGKVLPWEQIAALEIQVGQAGRRLRIRKQGGLLPWCYAPLDKVPNNSVLLELVRRLCPPRLLRG
jgi:hypothetical protein